MTQLGAGPPLLDQPGGRWVFPFSQEHHVLHPTPPTPLWGSGVWLLLPGAPGLGDHPLGLKAPVHMNVVKFGGSRGISPRDPPIAPVTVDQRALSRHGSPVPAPAGHR